MPPPAPGGFTPSSGRASGSGVLPAPEFTRVDEPSTAQAMWAVVFAGGIGSRFWPLSTPERPKPLLALVSEHSLLEDTVGRLQPLIQPDRVLVVTSRDIASAIRTAIRDVPEANILIEARPLGTAAALAWGAQEVARRAGPTSPVCAMHADLAVGFPGAFRDSLRRSAIFAVREEALVALGVRPTRPEPSFGYLQLGDALDADTPLAAGGAYHVTGFVEKPSEKEAAILAGDGALWHSGMIVGTARTIIEKLARYTPEIEPGLYALSRGNVAGFASQIRSVSIERGLLERVRRFLVVLADFGWDDVGTWASLRRARDLDDDGNGALGPVHFVDAASNVVHTEAGPVVLYGVNDLLVVNLAGLTFVTSLEKASDLKALLDALPGSMRIKPADGKS
ncbi:MAG TPA: sugar phosphate nucleotidyltransferase [Gemmatimonadaceae bacterium]|nr:sugar phosphate nucleotidyltransferase [Gemmatimonadaceae bacterium]